MWRLLPFAYKNLCSRVHPAQHSLRNYWQRRNVFSELSSAMQIMENRMKEMDREMNKLFDGLQRGSPLKRSPFEWIKGKEIPVLSKDGKNKNYQVELDMEGMDPEDIKITLKNNELTVTARKEEKGSDGSHFIRENKYHYTLPDNINPDAIRSTLADGILTIEAPLPALESKEIPVNIENSSSGSDSDKDSKKPQ
ncbi:protein lethal(2)essential for life [Parasteatoda tepidariorum]|uniref:protein lethal(2)essential for life n=1 Tax=Parasteatoda tepidariorum TaxID=114398 RepID=UPI00077F88DB|nr:protein lethal(2)essential for life [Parasteatoda tepidariorum]